jgi:GNAT superfamily N-acetyltransferase
MTSTQAKAQIDVRPYRDEDEPGVLELLEASLGGGPGGGRTHDFFAWKHLESPFGRSFMLVAEKDGRVIGLRAFMRWAFTAAGNEIEAVRAVDTATHPDHQGLGIFTKLTTSAIEQLAEEAAFVFNTPNDKSRPGYLKMGWRVSGELPISVKVRRPVRFARGIRGLRETASDSGAGPVVDAPGFSELALSDGELEALLRATRGADDRLITAHTAASLRWRYGQSPHLDYRAVGGADGLVIFRVRSRGSLWEATVAEVLVGESDAGAARSLLRDAAHSAGVDHMTCLLPSGSAALKGARRTGFVRSPIGMTLTTRPLQGGSPDPLDMRSWALSLGDVEVF